MYQNMLLQFIHFSGISMFWHFFRLFISKTPPLSISVTLGLSIHFIDTSFHSSSSKLLYLKIKVLLKLTTTFKQKHRIIYLLFLIFSIPEETKLTLLPFFKGITWAIFLFFCSSDIVQQPNKQVKSKGQLVNINLSFVTSTNKVLEFQ